MTDSLERRKAVRLPIVIPIEVRDARGFSLHSSSDLSTGGVYFDRAIPHPVGSKVELSFTLPGTDRALVCAGEVVNVPDAHKYGMGIQFLDLTPEDQAALVDFIRAEGGQ